jgi:hypothetical protein
MQLGILSAPARQKVLKQDNVEALNKRIRDSKYPDMEKIVHVWYTHALSKGVSISDEILTEIWSKQVSKYLPNSE